MGLTVRLEWENGKQVKDSEEVADPQERLHRLLPSYDDETYQCLRFIDWYGYTVFNRLQIDQFLAEWQRIRGEAQSTEDRELLSRIETLARRCTEEPHRYLRFIGD